MRCGPGLFNYVKLPTHRRIANRHASTIAVDNTECIHANVVDH